MGTKRYFLTKEERSILLLAALSGPQLGNTGIARRLGISDSRVKTLMHQACLKLGANNRNGAILSAAKRGEIILTESFSIDEMAEIVSSLGPDMLRRIAQLLGEKPKHKRLYGRSRKIIRTDMVQDNVLTRRERDALILVGRGLTNKEIAEVLYVTTKTVNTFLYRACNKLGARNRIEAVLLALRQRELYSDEIFTVNELIEYLAPLGSEAIEKMAQTLEQKPEE